MKIGFDSKRAVFNNTGLGNYSRLIIDVLSRHYPDNDYRLYSPRFKENPRLDDILHRKNVEMILPRTSFSRALSGLWRVSGMIVDDLKRDNVELYHGLSNELPLSIADSGIPSVVTIHDLIFLRYPEYYKPIDRKIYNYKFRKACENSSRVIAITECTKRDIVDFYGIDSAKIDVVYQGCSDIFTRQVGEEEKAEVRRSLGLPERFILYVGTIEQRKNLLLAVQALAKVDSSVHLVALGRKTQYAEKVEEYINTHHLSQRVHFYSGLDFNTLPVLYSMALASVYPSRFEGFGIPILESITCGTPAVGCTGSCLEEAGGDGALYVDPDDADALADALNSIIEDGDLRRRLVEAGRAYADKFSHESIARNIFDVYKKVVKI